MNMRQLALWLVLAAGSIATAAAQITIPVPGTGGVIQIPLGPVSIYVTGATYGSNCGVNRGNLTRELIDSCGGRDTCVYQIDMSIIGDPQPGCPKDFHVSYFCREGSPERWASLPGEASGRSILLDCRF